MFDYVCCGILFGNPIPRTLNTQAIGLSHLQNPRLNLMVVTQSLDIGIC